MGFLNFFKRREKDNKEIKYICLGVKAKHEEFCQEDLDSCFEFVKTFSGKVYKKKELGLISKKLGFNIEDYYVFIDDSLTSLQDKKLSFKILYLWQRVNENEFTTKEFTQNLNEVLSKKGFINRVEIENLSKEMGCSVWDRNTWISYSIIDYDFNDGQIYSCVKNPKENEELKKKLGKQ